jgi:hypothetical protein
MSYGYNGSRRFANYVSSVTPRKRRLLSNLDIEEVSSVDRGAGVGVRAVLLKRNHDQEEFTPMDNEDMLAARIAKSTADRQEGRISHAELAAQHQVVARKMFPDAKNAGVALTKFYDSEIGKRALQDANASFHNDLHNAYRIGDGDLAVQKMNDEDWQHDRIEPADKGECEISHDHPKQKKTKGKPARNNVGPGVYGTAPDDAAGPNRPLNWPENVVGKYTRACDDMAAAYGKYHGITKSAAYDELIRTHSDFANVWKAALTLPAE